MTESEVKKAFRIAYDFVESHQNPEFSKEYFSGVVGEIVDHCNNNKDNVLLECLMSGVYLYLSRAAKEGKQK